MTQFGDGAATYIVSYSVMTAMGEWKKKSVRTDLDGVKTMSRNWWKARNSGLVKGFTVMKVEDYGAGRIRSLLKI